MTLPALLVLHMLECGPSIKMYEHFETEYEV